jgi:RNA polymerase sigma factor (sigma-70 family)
VLGPVEVQIFENLYAAHADDARRAAYALLRDHELAEDAAHTAFLELFRYILAGKRWYEPAHARAAVVRNAKWAALKILRLQRRRPEAAISAVREPAVEDPTWARAEARALCEQVIARLAPSQQVALRLHFVDALTNTQAAERLGITTGAFDARLARAVRSARRVARSVGLMALGVLAYRAGCRRLRQAVATPAGAVSLRRVSAVLTSAVIATGVATTVAARGSGAVLWQRVASTPVIAAATEAAPRQPLDTPADSLIVDAIRLSGSRALLLADGRRCGCGVIFATQDAGRTWTPIGGPQRVLPTDRLALTAASPVIEVVIVEASGSTFSVSGLDPQWKPATGPSGQPVIGRPQRCRSGKSLVGCPGDLSPGSPGWSLPLDVERMLYISGDRHLFCSTDRGMSWRTACGETF